MKESEKVALYHLFHRALDNDYQGVSKDDPEQVEAYNNDVKIVIKLLKKWNFTNEALSKFETINQ